MKRYRVFQLGCLSLLVVLTGSMVAANVAAQGNAQSTGAFTLQPPVLDTPFNPTTGRDAERFSCELTTTKATLDYHDKEIDKFSDKGLFYTPSTGFLTWALPGSLVPGQAASLAITGSGVIGAKGQQPGIPPALYAFLDDTPPQQATMTQTNTGYGPQLSGVASTGVSDTIKGKRAYVLASGRATTPGNFEVVLGGVNVVYSITVPVTFTGDEIRLNILVFISGNYSAYVPCSGLVVFKYKRAAPPPPATAITCPATIEPAQRQAPTLYSTPKDQASYVLNVYVATPVGSHIYTDPGTIQIGFAWENRNKERQVKCFQQPLSAVYELNTKDRAEQLLNGTLFLQFRLSPQGVNLYPDLEVRYAILDQLEKIARDPKNAQQTPAKGEKLLRGSALDFDTQVFVYDSSGKQVAKSNALTNTKFTYQVRDPVVFVPGTAGSRLSSGGSQVWPQNLTQGSYGNTGSWAPMRLEDNGSGPQVTVGDVFRCYALCDVQSIYQGFFNHIGANGYQEGRNLLLFPYDWRLDIAKHPLNMDQVVNQALNLNYNRKAANSTVCIGFPLNTGVSATQCEAALAGRPAYTRLPDEKVVVITHSQGGLVARAYTAEQARADKVAYMIQLAPTNYGSLKALKVGMTGYSFEAPFLDVQVGKWMARNYPAAYFQWPVATDGSGKIDQVLFDEQNPPQTIPDVRGELAGLRTFMFCDRGIAGSKPGIEPCATSTMNPQLMDAAVAFHKNLPNPVKMGVPTYVVAGTDQQTIVAYKRSTMQVKTTKSKLTQALGSAMPANGFTRSISDTVLMKVGVLPPEAIDQPDYKIVDTLDIFTNKADTQYTIELPYYAEVTAPCGDNLVPLHRAVSLKDATRLYVPGVKHGGMTEAATVQALVDRLLDGVGLPDQGDPPCKSQPTSGVTQGTTIKIQNSPANLHVYDAQGRHTGFKADGTVELGIPGSYFEDRGAAQEAYLPPTVGALRVALEGLVDTTFDVRIVSGDGKTETRVDYLAIPETKTTRAEIKFTPSNLSAATALTVDSNGDGKADETRQPSLVTTASAAGASNTPPATPKAKGGGGCNRGSASAASDLGWLAMGLLYTGLVIRSVRPTRRKG